MTTENGHRDACNVDLRHFASDLALPPLPVLLAQVFLQDLAHGAPWERLDEVDALWRLDRSQAALAKSDQLFCRDAPAGFELDHRLDGLTPFVVRHPDDCTVTNGLVTPDDLLDLAGVHIESARDDHVLLAVGDMQISLRIEMADIPRMQPAIDDRLGGLVGRFVVARHEEVALHADLAGCALRQHRAGIVHDLDPNQRTRSSHGRQTLIARELSVDKMLLWRQI